MPTVDFQGLENVGSIEFFRIASITRQTSNFVAGNKFLFYIHQDHSKLIQGLKSKTKSVLKVYNFNGSKEWRFEKWNLNIELVLGPWSKFDVESELWCGPTIFWFKLLGSRKPRTFCTLLSFWF